MTDASGTSKKVSPLIPGILMMIILYVGILSNEMSHSAGRANRARCMSNLSSLGKCMVMYAMDHEEQHPALWSDISKEDYTSKAQLFICPSSGNEAGKLSEVDQWSDYVLIALSSNSAPTSVHAYCPPANHNDAGGHVLHLDGSVRWLSKEEFAKAVGQE